MKIIKNRARCKNCGDIIESRHTHEMVWCSCQSIAVDGGHSYLRWMAKDLKDIEDLSICLSVYLTCLIQKIEKRLIICYNGGA